jgi:hypothetical protein
MLVYECFMSQVLHETRETAGRDIIDYHLLANGQTFIISSKAKALD